MNRRNLSITVALGTIVAAILYPLVAWLLGLQVEGYSHLRDHISELGLTSHPYAWILSAVLVADGVLLLVLASVVHRTIGEPRQDRWAGWLLGTFGAALIAGGLFPCDANCRPTSFHGWVHALNLVPSAVAIIGAPFAVSRKFSRDPRLNHHASLSFILGSLMIVAIVMSLTLFPVLDLVGFGQRLVLFFQLSFFILVASAVVHVNLGITSLDKGRHATTR